MKYHRFEDPEKIIFYTMYYGPFHQTFFSFNETIYDQTYKIQ